MADFSSLKTAIQNAIRTNGNNEITGQLLQDILLSMVVVLGDEAITNVADDLSTETSQRQNADGTLQGNINAEATERAVADTALQNAINTINSNISNGYVYAGIATPSATPVTGKVFYIATTAGTYTNFGGLTVTKGINILKYNGSTWSQEQIIGIDDYPTAGSSGLALSGGVDAEIKSLVGYYTCGTAAATAAKTITASAYILLQGGSIKVKFTYKNTAADATLKIGSADAKPLFYGGRRAGSSNSWEAGEVVEIFYDGTNYMANNVMGGGAGDGAFDISVYNAVDGTPTPYTDLAAALGTNGANIPDTLRKGGMSVKFIQGTVQSSDNKYVQARFLLSGSFTDAQFTNVDNWQGVDDEPTAGSENLVKSGGVSIFISAQKPDATKEAVYINPSTGEKSEWGSSSGHTYFFDNRNYDRLEATVCGQSSLSVAIAFYSGEVSSSTYMKDYTVLCSGNYNRYKEKVSANIPFGCKIIAIVSRVPQNDVTEDDIQFNLHLGGRDLTYLEQDIKDLNTEIQDLNTEIQDLNTEIQDLNTEIQGLSKTEEDYEPMAGGVYIGVDGSINPNSSMKSYSIQNSGFTKISGKVSVRNTNPPYVGFYDSEEPSTDSFISGIVFSDEGVHEFSSLIPLGTLSIVLCSDKRISDILEFEISKESVDERFKSLNEEIDALETPKVLYVSPNGNDNNSGESLINALATVDGALRKGCEVVLLDDGIYNQDINVSLGKEYKITIKPAFDGARPIFKNPHTTYVTDNILTESGKVKKVVLSEDIDSGVLYLFVENVPDATTAISEAERHPLQRGKEYRLENTIIKKLRNISDSSIAIETIESSDAYSWWYDATNKTLYFSAPVDIDSSHPLVITSRSYGLLKNTSRNHSIVIQDAESWYGAIMLYNMSDAELYGCSAKYICHSGGIAWDLTTSIKLIRCEAAAVAYISNGDGFNGHARYNTETAFSKARMCTDITIDCWSHDNYDDGHSVHELCESTVIGGLYEYNGKFGVGGGIGAEYTLYDVTARSNYINYGESIGDDFTYDNSGSMTCHNCISLNAKYGGFSPFGSSEAQGNPIIDCIDCKSYNDYRNYRNNSVNGKVILRNCIAVNSSPTKYKDGSGTIEVINGDTVS